jgi:exodeoxyribonuclease VII large subunit
VFDDEQVCRAIAAATVPVVTGIGHEVDRFIADEAAAVARKTPTDAAAWLVSAVQEFADRIAIARGAIRDQARSATERLHRELDGTADLLVSMETRLRHERILLSHHRDTIAESARAAMARQWAMVESLDQWFGTIGVDKTLARGFALVTSVDGTVVVRSVDQVAPGDPLLVRLADGTVPVVVEEP